MSRVFNFSAGPATLPQEVLEQARDELLEWNGSGTSVMEMSHRGKEFMSIAEKAEADLREIMAIPSNYKVLFLQGGASSQFAMVPLNLLGDKTEADYAHTGHWSKKAIKEAQRFCQVNVVADTEASKYTTIPDQDQWQINPNAAYLHYTPNETIAGVEFSWVPETGDVPLVADMSSTILSRPCDVSRYGLIYTGAQKNIGQAGLTVVIVREDLIGHAPKNIPSMYDYQVQAKSGSMANTPPTYAWYIAGLVFARLKAMGGLKEVGAINQRKAQKLYDCIDTSGGFYRNPVDKACRSWMNIPFILRDEGLDSEFLQQAAAADLLHLKGHRSVGGMRASIYNAMPEEGVDALVKFMNTFMQLKG